MKTVPKTILLTLFFVFSTQIILVAQTDSTTQTTDDQKPNPDHKLESHRSEIQNIIKTEEKGVFRGFDFGVNSEEIKKNETAQYIADGKDFMIYKQLLRDNDDEYAEVIYYLDEQGNAKGFGIEFIIKESDYQEEANIVGDFQNYFNSRYGKYTVNNQNDEVWDAGTYTVEMGDSSEGGGDALEIEVEIFPKKTK